MELIKIDLPLIEITDDSGNKINKFDRKALDIDNGFNAFLYVLNKLIKDSYKKDDFKIINQYISTYIQKNKTAYDIFIFAVNTLTYDISEINRKMIIKTKDVDFNDKYTLDELLNLIRDGDPAIGIPKSKLFIDLCLTAGQYAIMMM